MTTMFDGLYDNMKVWHRVVARAAGYLSIGIEKRMVSRSKLDFHASALRLMCMAVDLAVKRDRMNASLLKVDEIAVVGGTSHFKLTWLLDGKKIDKFYPYRDDMERGLLNDLINTLVGGYASTQQVPGQADAGMHQHHETGSAGEPVLRGKTRQGRGRGQASGMAAKKGGGRPGIPGQN